MLFLWQLYYEYEYQYEYSYYVSEHYVSKRRQTILIIFTHLVAVGAWIWE